MNYFNIGDKVVLTGNCSYNYNVETNESPLLCNGKYSCDEAERNTVLTVIGPRFDKTIFVKRLYDDGFHKVPKDVNFVTVKSSKTGNVYAIDTAWARSYNDDKTDAMKSQIEFDKLLSELNDSFMEDYLNDPRNDTFEDFYC